MTTGFIGPERTGDIGAKPRVLLQLYGLNSLHRDHRLIPDDVTLEHVVVFLPGDFRFGAGDLHAFEPLRTVEEFEDHAPAGPDPFRRAARQRQTGRAGYGERDRTAGDRSAFRDFPFDAHVDGDDDHRRLDGRPAGRLDFAGNGDAGAIGAGQNGDV